jgi:hypothetical protein
VHDRSWVKASIDLVRVKRLELRYTLILSATKADPQHTLARLSFFRERGDTRVQARVPHRAIVVIELMIHSFFVTFTLSFIILTIVLFESPSDFNSLCSMELQPRNHTLAARSLTTWGGYALFSKDCPTGYSTCGTSNCCPTGYTCSTTGSAALPAICCPTGRYILRCDTRSVGD